MASADANAFTIVFDDSGEMPSAQELRQSLEKGSDDLKIDTLRKIIVATLNGNAQPTLLMPIIQFVLPSKNKALKKLLHFYWEVCPKYDDNGKLKQEMILVINAIRNDLQHPNEYIRGATLRFLQKVKDAELLEPLVPTCRACLEHRHSYVRKNAILAVFTIYQTFEHLVPDAPELVHTFLAAESDNTCKRNAFIFLSHCAPNRAQEWLLSVLEQVTGFDELLQMAAIEFIRKDSKSDHRRKYVQCISELLSASSTSVKYEAAMTLTGLTQNAVAVKAAAQGLVEVMLKESDNNVKMIVLDRLDALRRKHEHVLDALVMDVLRVLQAPDIDVRRRAIGIALSMVSTRNADEVVTFLNKQLVRTLDQDYEKNLEYRQLLIQSIHALAVRFSDVAGSVVTALMEFLADANSPSAADAIAFVREVVEKFPHMRAHVIERLLSAFPTIKSGKVFRGALWIVGEYCADAHEIQDAFVKVRAVLGEVPILAAEQRALEESGTADESAAEGSSKPKGGTTKVLADGTYVTETAYSAAPTTGLGKDTSGKPPLRALLLGGDFYTGAVLAATLAKLVLRHRALSSAGQTHNALRAEAMLIMTSTVRLGQSTFASAPIDEDASERIVQCIQTLALTPDAPATSIDAIFLKDTKAAYAKMVATEERKAKEKKEKESKESQVQVDDLLSFRQFAKKAGGDIEEDLGRATGAGEVKEDLLSNLSRVVQLTGFSDPVYAEAIVKVHNFDILLDVLIVNQTPQTLQNLCIEFATLGDLKLVERMGTHTLAPHGFHSVKATIKVASTETGVIFGNIIWENGPGTAETCVILNDIHIDIMDYIKPATCTETQFRSMWTEFEWENRVNVVTTITDLRQYLAHIMKCTNMNCLTPDAALEGECDFLSANLYARSLFGEDALANLSLERMAETGAVTGYVRIRSKTQGIALSLGDKITLAQKEVPPAA
ncbi:Coatomer, beta subunit [Exidia glandulosa HHB12029]|uniref:Coatomer subunit beta n=1 Tax=Exidia glandulosa HHB12029 TaxID=1314781 RepID=A0A165BSD0_EXIGL|nr:Coatomer, beta subunit [Exidia glandulosa HHB12029]